jgi:hypothetical protein
VAPSERKRFAADAVLLTELAEWLASGTHSKRHEQIRALLVAVHLFTELGKP